MIYQSIKSNNELEKICAKFNMKVKLIEQGVYRVFSEQKVNIDDLVCNLQSIILIYEDNVELKKR